MQVEGCRAYRASGVHVSTSVMLTVTVIAVSGLAGVGGRGALVYNVLSQALSTWRVDDLLCWAVDVHKSSFTLNEACLLMKVKILQENPSLLLKSIFPPEKC